MLDQEGEEAEGVAAATLRLQQDFTSYYDASSQRAVAAEEEEARDSTVPLPAER